MKKNPDVANSVSYKRVKYQVQILNITSYRKMKNLIKFGDLKMYILRSKTLSFLCRTVHELFKLIFCRFVEYTISYICDFFHIFLKLANSIFEISKTPGSLVPGARNIHSIKFVYFRRSLSRLGLGPKE